MAFLSAIKKAIRVDGFVYGREEGIRTLDTFRYTHFPGVLLQPLGHLSRNFILTTAVLFPLNPEVTEHAARSLFGPSCASPVRAMIGEA